MTQPEALRLADWLDELAAVTDMGRMPHPTDYRRKAAAELRRLSAVEAQRDALLEALSEMLEQFNYNTITGIVHDESAAIAKARAAIKAVEETK